MDQPAEPLLLTKSNENLENIRKAYAKGGVSISEILAELAMKPNFESYATSSHFFIPQNLLDSCSDLEAAFDAEVKFEKDEPLPKPYIPGPVFFNEHVDSSLTKQQHAMALNALKVKQSAVNPLKLTKIEKNDLVRAQEIQHKIHEENKKYYSLVKNDWTLRHGKRTLILREAIKAYGTHRWKIKLMRAHNYPPFYVSHSTIPFSSHIKESAVDVTQMGVLYETGIVPKFLKPSLECPFILKPSTLPSDEKDMPSSKLCVSQDPKIPELLKTTPADIVISSSGLKQLMNDSHVLNEWCIPVVVKKHRIESENKDKLVVYIDKPMAKQNPKHLDLYYYCHKMLLKTNFCSYAGVILNTSEACAPSNDVPPHNTGNDDGTEKHKIFHNVTYRHWSMKPKNEQNEILKAKLCSKHINVIVRCKLDACEALENGKGVRPLVIVPKVELQLEYGAGVVTKNELINQWTSLFFRPFSDLYRIRLQHNKSIIVDVQSSSLQKLNIEAFTQYQYRPHLRLDVLHEILASLTELKEGNYLLHFRNSKGPFIEILEKTDSNTSILTYNLHLAYNYETFSICNSMISWVPIDTTYILPVHTTFKRMPGMFKPLIVKHKKKQSAKRRYLKHKNKKKHKNTVKK